MLTQADIQSDFDDVNAKIAQCTGSTDTSKFNQLVNKIDLTKTHVATYGSQGNTIGTAVSLLTDAHNWVNPAAHTLGQCQSSVNLAHAQIFGQ